MAQRENLQELARSTLARSAELPHAVARSASALSLDDAVERLAGHPYATREEAERAWRKLCQLILDGRLHPRGRHQDGTTFPVDTDQFHDMADRYFRYASCTRHLELEPPAARAFRSDPPPGATGWGDRAVARSAFRFVKIEGPGSYKLRDERGAVHPDCNLIFLEAEIDSKIGAYTAVTGGKPT